MNDECCPEQVIDNIDNAILLIESIKVRISGKDKPSKNVHKSLAKVMKALVLARIEVQEAFGDKENDSQP